MVVINYRDMSNGPIEICRDMCNALMKHQTKRAEMGKQILGSMNFDNRLKLEFDQFDEKGLLVAFDGDQPVGYILVTAAVFNEEMRKAEPEWGAQFSAQHRWLYPDWLTAGTKIATLDNLYVSPDYRGEHIGGHLIDYGMNWLHQSGAETLFVYVSNGNDPAPLYQRLGFQYSHSVCDGLIEAYSMANN